MNRIHKQTLISLAAGAALLAIGATGGWWWSQRSMASMDMGESTQAEGQGKVLYWYDPMYPQQKFDQPGKSPFMDMELVPKYADGNGESAGIKIDPTITQSLGMRLAPVTSISLASQIDATGVIGFNERDVAIVQSRAAGFVERVASLAPGDVVKAGQALVEVQVPEWLSAQHEFLALKSAGDPALLAAARDRLRSVGMSDGMIREVESAGQPRARFTVSAPIDGMPHTAPAYDEITKPVIAPEPVGCIAYEDQCKCLTQQGTVYQTTDQLCRDMLKNGPFFMPWKAPQRQESPQRADNSIGPASATIYAPGKPPEWLSHRLTPSPVDNTAANPSQTRI